MNIPVGDKYILTSDTHNIVVNKVLVNEKTGEKYPRPESYHTSLRDAIRGLFERGVRRSDAESVAELAEHRGRVDQVKISA
jgi:hypothetical protein